MPWWRIGGLLAMSVALASTTWLGDNPARAKVGSPTPAAALAPMAVDRAAGVSDRTVLARFDDLLHQWHGLDQAELLQQLQLQLAALPVASRQAVLALFQRYLAYKQALASIEATTFDTGLDPESLARQLDEIEALQLAFFSADEVARLFDEQRQRDQAALARLRLRQDDQLTEVERQRLLAENLASQPEAVRRALAPTLSLRQLQSGQGIESLPAAVQQRLSQQRLQQQHWRQRASTTLAQLRAISADANLSPQQQQQASDAVLAQYSPDERKRLSVYLRHGLNQ
ncbi:lipase secretion chaperone [Ferrimonas kyonanensis]|uniref:lipase secretion chaperone n=1 Tax=Ferrimonas kyonanensis TaxID=364763 RepID=UPI000A02B0EB|nr:lipase secretion chaperone [Ferrimonas kyonanensis]